jgi:hypothetical protein
MILKDNNLVLKPTKDLSYILELISQYKYSKLSEQVSLDVLREYGYKFWEVYVDEKKSGVIYITYIPKLGYLLDAYKDQRVKNDLRYSEIAGKLVINYFHKHIFPILFTSHDIRNRLATLVCRRLGFKKIDTITSKLGEFILMRRDK